MSLSLPAGHKVTGAETLQITNIVNPLSSAWTAYTPAWTATTTNPALGNGTLTGAYLQAGKLGAVRIALTTGSTSTYGSGSWRFSLPFAFKASTLLAVMAEDSVGVRYSGQCLVIAETSTGDNMRMVTSQATSPIDPTHPFTWAASFKLYVAGSGETL